MPLDTAPTSPNAGPAPSDDDDDPYIADLTDVYPDKTLVLIAGGTEQRAPDDDLDTHIASVESSERLHRHGPHGPAWKAKDLYTSTEFAAAREFARKVTRWTGDEDTGWAVLSPEHGVLEPFEKRRPYDTTIEDIGDNPTNPDHHIDHYWKRRPDGREIVTEMDAWATNVAVSLMKWIARTRPIGGHPTANDANALLVATPQKLAIPLRDRGVFEFGLARMRGNPNSGFKQPLTTHYLFEEQATTDARLAWLSDAVSRFDANEYDSSRQAEVGSWTGNKRSCDHCTATPDDAELTAVGGGVYCEECHPDRCSRCDNWTHENGLGGYPLCEACQTDGGGRISDPVTEDHTVQETFVD